jgi:putative MATE family efflux protein
MTKGNIPKHLLGFAVPLVLGNLFQLTYNAVDSIIVGRFVGAEALASVGSANPIMNLVIFFIVGICMGASVLMSEYFGAGDIPKLKREISTALLVGLGFSIAMSILCFLLAKPILMLTRTPKEIIGASTTYLRVVFSGLIFTFLYNIYAATLRSMGDAKTPIIFLIFSSVLNIGLDLVMVVGLNLGVIGVAIATVIAQGLSCILCIVYVYIKVPLLRFKREELVIDPTLLKITLSYSWVTAMQQTCLYFGKLLIQSAVNGLGIHSIAAFNAVNRVDDFVFTPQQSIANSMTTFIAQNRGAKKKKRIQQGFRYGMGLECTYWAIIFVIIYFNAHRIMSIFQPKDGGEVIQLGVIYLQNMAFFYIMPALTNGIQGFFRGMGRLKVTLIATFVQMVFRVLFAYILAPRLGMAGIAYSCFLGWVFMLLYEIPVYLRARKALHSEIEEELIKV